MKNKQKKQEVTKTDKSRNMRTVGGVALLLASISILVLRFWSMPSFSDMRVFHEAMNLTNPDISTRILITDIALFVIAVACATVGIVLLLQKRVSVANSRDKKSR